MPTLLKINPDLDLPALATQFAEHKRISIRNVLTDESAREIALLLARDTPWGLSWKAGDAPTQKLSKAQTDRLQPRDVDAMLQKLAAAMSAKDFAFVYSQYRIHDAVEQGWSKSPRHDALVADINSPEFIALAEAVTGIEGLTWVDSQATLYAPGQFLSVHQDVVEGEGRRIAYVLNFCTADWRPDWGGYLNFYDEQGDIAAGYRPRFNSLNLFQVPQHHSVSFVPAFAPHARFAVTGWFRDS